MWRRVAKGLRTPRRIRDAQLRTGFLTRGLQLPFVLLIQVLVVLTTVVLWMRRRVREWLRGIAAARKVETRTRRESSDTPISDSELSDLAPAIARLSEFDRMRLVTAAYLLLNRRDGRAGVARNESKSLGGRIACVSSDRSRRLRYRMGWGRTIRRDRPGLGHWLRGGRRMRRCWLRVDVGHETTISFR